MIFAVKVLPFHYVWAVNWCSIELLRYRVNWQNCCFVCQLKYSGESDYAQVCNLNLRASHLQSIQHLDKVSAAAAAEWRLLFIITTYHFTLSTLDWATFNLALIVYSVFLWFTTETHLQKWFHCTENEQSNLSLSETRSDCDLSVLYFFSMYANHFD